MMRVLVTGVAGFIGSHLADALLARGDYVVGIDNFNDYYNPLLKRANLTQASPNRNFVLIEQDICEENAFKQVFKDIRPDVVVHLAARGGVRPSLENPKLYNHVNITGTQHILDACRETSPSHCVLASSSSVYGGIQEVPFVETMNISSPISPYAATKRMNEYMGHVYSHVYGLNITMLRFFTVYGPRQRPDMAIHKFTKLIREGQPIPMFGDGSTRRDYTYIDDIIDGLLKAIDTPFQYEIFNLGEQHTTSLRELIDLISKHTGKEAVIDEKPLQPGDVEITYADISKARSLLGYTPSVSMDEGIRRFVDWFDANH
jgi:UDP-glucuronate 4-epimerase